MQQHPADFRRIEERAFELWQQRGTVMSRLSRARERL